MSPNSHSFDGPEASTPVATSRVSCRPNEALPTEPSRSRSARNPRKSTAFSVSSNLTGLPSGPSPPPDAGGVVERLRLARAEVALADHPLDDLLQELVERVLLAHELPHLLLGEQAAAENGVEDRVVERLQVVLVPLVHFLPEAALQEEVGELVDEVLEVEVLPELADVPVVRTKAIS